MDFTFTDEQLMMRDTARAFFAKYTPTRRSAEARSRLWSDIAAMGWMSVMVPQEKAGFGGSIVDGCLLASELGRGSAVLPFIETAILGATAFRRDDDMLALIGSGGVRLAFALGWDTATLFTLQGRSLHGTRAFLSADPATDVLIAEATLPDGGSVILAIPLDHAGVRIARNASLDGMGAISISLEDVCITDRHVIAESSMAEEIISDLRLLELLARAAEATGLMEYLLNLTRDYTLTRQQFGQPIAGFQVIRHRLVEMYAYWQLSESLLFQAADTLVRLGPIPESRQAVRAAFSFIARQARQIGKEAIQLHGAIGTMDEYPAGHAFARMVSIAQSCGGVAFQEREYARAIMPTGDTSRLWAL